MIDTYIRTHTHTLAVDLLVYWVSGSGCFSPIPFLLQLLFLVMSRSTALLCHHFSVEDLKAHLDSTIFVEACKATENLTLAQN